MWGSCNHPAQAPCHSSARSAVSCHSHEIPASAIVLLINPLPEDFPAEAGGAGDGCSDVPRLHRQRVLPPGPRTPAGSASWLQHLP